VLRLLLLWGNCNCDLETLTQCAMIPHVHTHTPVTAPIAARNCKLHLSTEADTDTAHRRTHAHQHTQWQTDRRCDWMQQSTTAPPQAHSHANTDTNAQWDETVIYRPELTQKKNSLLWTIPRKQLNKKIILTKSAFMALTQITGTIIFKHSKFFLYIYYS